MTLSIAWVRKVNNCEELVIASDSRLNGGIRWDQCPKIITLPRSDSAICFAGNSLYTYPIMIQLINAISAYGRSRDRAMDLHDLRGFALNVFNSLQSSVVFENMITRDSELTDTEFILGGYSWIRKSFSIFLIQYSPHYKHFVVRPHFNLGNLGKIILAGDWKHKGKDRLVEILRKKYGKNLAGDNVPAFDMEPLEALSELLLDAGRDDTIGGPPQLVKIYQHMNCKPIGVLWPPGAEAPDRTVLGRKLFEFEDSDHWFIDTKTLRTQRIEKPQT